MRHNSRDFVREPTLCLTLRRRISSCDGARLRQTGGSQSVSSLPNLLQKTKTDKSASHVAPPDTRTVQFHINSLRVRMVHFISAQSPGARIPFPCCKEQVLSGEIFAQIAVGTIKRS